jgi:hypothetical protein
MGRLLNRRYSAAGKDVPHFMLYFASAKWREGAAG